VRDAAGKETVIATDARGNGAPPCLPAKKAAWPAFDPKDWKKARTVVQTLPHWQQTSMRRHPMLLAQGAAANGRMIRASLMKADFLMRTLGRPNRDQIVSTRPNELTTLEAIDLANGSILADTIAKGAKRLLEPRQPISSRRFTATPCHVIHLSAAEKPCEGAASDRKPTLQGLEDLLWSVCMLPEFQVVR
jgi:hypothetical protein